MLNIIMVAFWTTTYLIILYYAAKYKEKRRRTIPIAFASMNIVWETVALLASGGTVWGHWFWIIVNVCIFTYNLYTVEQKWKKVCYLVYIFVFIFLMTILTSVVCYWFFFSSFMINLIGSVLFLIERRKLLPQGKCIIAVTKLIGSVAATIEYIKYSKIMGIVGICIFFVDVVYLICCVKERKSGNADYFRN